MDLESLRHLVESGESETLEFKRSLAEREAAAKTICAMLNGPHVGMVVFGFKNDGSIQSVETDLLPMLLSMTLIEARSSSPSRKRSGTAGLLIPGRGIAPHC